MILLSASTSVVEENVVMQGNITGFVALVLCK